MECEVRVIKIIAWDVSAINGNRAQGLKLDPKHFLEVVASGLKISLKSLIKTDPKDFKTCPKPLRKTKPSGL